MPRGFDVQELAAVFHYTILFKETNWGHCDNFQMKFYTCFTYDCIYILRLLIVPLVPLNLRVVTRPFIYIDTHTVFTHGNYVLLTYKRNV